MEGHAGQLLGQEVAGDAEAERGHDGLADDRDEAAGEEDDPEEGDAQQDAYGVPGGDPQFAPERQPGLVDLAALAALDLLGERLVERLADQERDRGEGDDGEEEAEDEDQRGQRGAEQAEPG